MKRIFLLFLLFLLFSCSDYDLIYYDEPYVKIYNKSSLDLEFNMNYEQIFYIMGDVDYFKRSYDDSLTNTWSYKKGYNDGYNDGYADERSDSAINIEDLTGIIDADLISGYNDGYDDGELDGTDERLLNGDFDEYIQNLKENFTVSSGSSMKFYISWKSYHNYAENLYTKCNISIVGRESGGLTSLFDKKVIISPSEEIDVYILDTTF